MLKSISLKKDSTSNPEPKVFTITRREISCFTFECWYDISSCEDEYVMGLDDLVGDVMNPEGFKKLLKDGMTCCVLPNFPEIEEWWADNKLCESDREFIIVVLNDDRKSTWAVVNSKYDTITW